MFLPRAALEELTDLVMPAAQCRWLERNGYPFELSAARRPKVLTAYVQQRLGVASLDPKAQSNEPDFSQWE